MPATKQKKIKTLVPLTAYVPPETVNRVDKQRAGEDRRRGQMVRRLIDEALDAREQSLAAAAK